MSFPIHAQATHACFSLRTPNEFSSSVFKAYLMFPSLISPNWCTYSKTPFRSLSIKWLECRTMVAVSFWRSDFLVIQEEESFYLLWFLEKHSLLHCCNRFARQKVAKYSWYAPYAYQCTARDSHGTAIRLICHIFQHELDLQQLSISQIQQLKLVCKTSGHLIRQVMSRLLPPWQLRTDTNGNL